METRDAEKNEEDEKMIEIEERMDISDTETIMDSIKNDNDEFDKTKLSV